MREVLNFHSFNLKHVYRASIFSNQGTIIDTTCQLLIPNFQLQSRAAKKDLVKCLKIENVTLFKLLGSIFDEIFLKNFVFFAKLCSELTFFVSATKVCTAANDGWASKKLSNFCNGTYFIVGFCMRR